METLGILLQIIVIIGFAIYSYTKIKGQELRDTFEEIKIMMEIFRYE